MMKFSSLFLALAAPDAVVALKVKSAAETKRSWPNELFEATTKEQVEEIVRGRERECHEEIEGPGCTNQNCDIDTEAPRECQRSRIVFTGPHHKTDAFGRTALFYAPNAEVVNALLKAGTKLNKTDCESKTALYYAKNVEVARALIEAGANPGTTIASIDKTAAESNPIVLAASEVRAVCRKTPQDPPIRDPRPNGQLYSGNIVQKNSNGTYVIKFKDGDVDHAVLPANIRMVKNPKIEKAAQKQNQTNVKGNPRATASATKTKIRELKIPQAARNQKTNQVNGTSGANVSVRDTKIREPKIPQAAKKQKKTKVNGNSGANVSATNTKVEVKKNFVNKLTSSMNPFSAELPIDPLRNQYDLKVYDGAKHVLSLCVPVDPAEAVQKVCVSDCLKNPGPSKGMVLDSIGGKSLKNIFAQYAGRFHYVSAAYLLQRFFEDERPSTILFKNDSRSGAQHQQKKQEHHRLHEPKSPAVKQADDLAAEQPTTGNATNANTSRPLRTDEETPCDVPMVVEATQHAAITPHVETFPLRDEATKQDEEQVENPDQEMEKEEEVQENHEEQPHNGGCRGFFRRCWQKMCNFFSGRWR